MGKISANIFAVSSILTTFAIYASEKDAISHGGATEQ
jgi:hypothetical protein